MILWWSSSSTEGSLLKVYTAPVWLNNFAHPLPSLLHAMIVLWQIPVSTIASMKFIVWKMMWDEKNDRLYHETTTHCGVLAECKYTLILHKAINEINIITYVNDKFADASDPSSVGVLIFYRNHVPKVIECRGWTTNQSVLRRAYFAIWCDHFPGSVAFSLCFAGTVGTACCPICGWSWGVGFECVDFPDRMRGMSAGVYFSIGFAYNI